MKKYWVLITAVILLVVGFIINTQSGNVIHVGNFSCEYFSAGDYAFGVFAAGEFSVGIFSVGIFSVGIFSLGIFNVGLYAVGIFLFAWKKKYAKIISETKEESEK